MWPQHTPPHTPPPSSPTFSPFPPSVPLKDAAADMKNLRVAAAWTPEGILVLLVAPLLQVLLWNLSGYQQ